MVDVRVFEESKVSLSLSALLGEVFDYAGTFPPAALPIDDAVRKYVAAQSSAHSWMLGRFVVSEGDLACVPESLTSKLAVVLSGGGPGAMARAGVFEELAQNGRGVERATPRANEFVPDMVARSRALCAFETKTVLKLDRPTYCEVALGQLDDVVSAGSFAKLRTTGLSGNEIVEYLMACAARRLPLKATAGLHFAIRRGEQHGFMNVLLAACFVRLGKPVDLVRQVLDETDAKAFRLTETGAVWRDIMVLVDEIAATRRDFFHSIGSCSFADPVESLRALGWV